MVFFSFFFFFSFVQMLHLHREEKTNKYFKKIRENGYPSKLWKGAETKIKLGTNDGLEKGEKRNIYIFSFEENEMTILN